MPGTADEVVAAAMAERAGQKPAELLEMVSLLLERRPQVVLEIGTDYGGTLKAWCECAADDALIISLDFPGGPWGDGYTEDHIPHLRTFAKPGQTLELIQGNSTEETGRVRDLLGGRGIDFLFIDGDHGLPGTCMDFAFYAPLVASGGLIAFHDVVDHPEVPGVDVNLLWNCLRLTAKTREFVFDGDERGFGPWAGIGVIEWKRQA